jgi:hypothetical protein
MQLASPTAPQQLEAAAADFLGRLATALREAEATGDHERAYRLMTIFWRTACPRWARRRTQLVPAQAGISVGGRIEAVPAAVHIALLDWTAIASLITAIHGPLSSSDMDAMIRAWLMWSIFNDEADEDWQSNYHRYLACFAEAEAIA